MSLDCRLSAGLNWGVPGAGWDLHETQSQLAEKPCPPDPVSDWIPYREAAAAGKASPFPWLGNCGKMRKPRDNGCLDCGSLSQQFREGGSQSVPLHSCLLGAVSQGPGQWRKVATVLTR